MDNFDYFNVIRKEFANFFHERAWCVQIACFRIHWNTTNKSLYSALIFCIIAFFPWLHLCRLLCNFLYNNLLREQRTPRHLYWQYTLMSKAAWNAFDYLYLDIARNRLLTEYIYILFNLEDGEQTNNIYWHFVWYL